MREKRITMSIQKLIDTYAHWLKEEIVFKKMGEFYEITTPFYNNANDCIQIYIRLEGETVLFTDDGYTLNNKPGVHSPSSTK